MENDKSIRLKSLATIGAIVKDFAYNVRPTLNPPFNEATTFRAWTFGEFKGDSRHMRIYKWMLQRAGAQMIQVNDDESSLSWKLPMSLDIRIESIKAYKRILSIIKQIAKLEGEILASNVVGIRKKDFQLQTKEN